MISDDLGLHFQVKFWGCWFHAGPHFGPNLGVVPRVFWRSLNATKKTLFSGPPFWNLKNHIVVVSCVTVVTFNVNLIFFGTPNHPPKWAQNKAANATKARFKMKWKLNRNQHIFDQYFWGIFAPFWVFLLCYLEPNSGAILGGDLGYRKILICH